MKNQNHALTKEQIDRVVLLYSSGKIEESISAIKALNNDYPNVPLLFNLLGACYKALGKLEASAKAFEVATTIKPDYAEAYNNLGIVQMQLRSLDVSVESFKRAIAIKPDYVEAHGNLGMAFKELNLIEEAVKAYEKVIYFKPDYAEAHNNLGNLLKALGMFYEAVKCYEKSLDIKSDYVEAHNNLGAVFKELNRFEDAVKSYETALSINPKFAEAHNNLGVVFKELNRFEDAVKSYETALSINPKFAEAHNNLGAAFKELDQPNKAAHHYDHALKVNPNFAEAYFNYGGLMTGLKKLDEALSHYEAAYKLKPEIGFLYGNLLQIKMRLCSWASLAKELNELELRINRYDGSLPLFFLQALIDDPMAQKKAAISLNNKYYPKNFNLPPVPKYPEHKRVRVGYFSADFREHPVSDLVVGLFEEHDRSQFEVYAFYFGPKTNDKMNLRIKKGADKYYEAGKMSDVEVAKLARTHELDIAIDLGGYTASSRTKIFAMSAAPIQVSYLGFTGTMGSKYIDYIIADQFVIPKGSQKYYTENIAYLPNSYMINESNINPSKKLPRRKDHGLPIDGFVFCCFNNHFKITPSIFGCWMSVLAQVDGSVLWLSEAHKSTSNNLKKEAKIHGIDPNRLVFASRVPLKEDHLSRLQLADLFVDTHPFNAHVTASDALRIGLPVLTCRGKSFASRVAGSLLTALDLPELITTSQEQYELLAVNLAKSPEQLKTTRAKLIENLSRSSLFDSLNTVRQLESAYLAMREKSLQELQPENIYIEQYKQYKN
jgi:protein O-GlcNAc transferase